MLRVQATTKPNQTKSMIGHHDFNLEIFFQVS